MNSGFARVLIRTLGTALGLIGVYILCMTPIMVMSLIREGVLGGLILFALPVVIGSYLTYMGYSIWHKSSPLVVRNVCAVSGFIALSYCFWLIDHRWMSPSRALDFLKFLVCLGGAYVVGRFAGDWLNKLLWPNKTSDALPQKH